MEKKNNYGADMVGGLGTLSRGISKCGKEGGAEPLVSLTNKFSALHDTSMKEVMRKVGGKGTSSMEE